MTSCFFFAFFCFFFFARLSESHPKTLHSHLGEITARMRTSLTVERGAKEEEMKTRKKMRSRDKIFFLLINLTVHQAGRCKHVQSQTRGREEISIFGERRRMREMRVRECERTERVCLCCVSRHLCVRAHHGNCEGRRRWGWPAPTPPLSPPPSAGHTQTFANARLRFVRLAHLKPMETGAKPADAIAVSFFYCASV